MEPDAVDEEADLVGGRVYPWWSLVLPLLAALALLWWLALRPLAGIFAPSWQPATWHLLEARDQTLTVMVEYLDCGGLGADAPPVRFEVQDSGAEVDVRAFVAADTVPVPQACPGHRLTTATVVLDRPLDGRGLYGCRHDHSGMIDSPPAGCAGLADEFGLSGGDPQAG